VFGSFFRGWLVFGNVLALEAMHSLGVFGLESTRHNKRSP
jgi:hypothetical protein